MKTVKKSSIDIEALLAKKEAISSTVIQNALIKLKEEKEKEQEREVLANLEEVQSNTKSAVESLRNARTQEKKCKAYLQAIADAEAAFFTNADYSAYNMSISAANKVYWN